MITKSFLVRVGADTKEMERGLKSAEARMKKFSEKCTKIGRGMMIGGAAIIGALTMITKKASDAQETFSKFGTVFQDSITEAEGAANELTKSYGLSMLAAKDMLSATGDLLTGLGLQGKTALSLSRRTQKLSVDLASFSNYAGGAKGASEALTKAMLGERESVKALGIVITEEMVKEQLLKAGKEDLTGMALLQAKAEATLAIAVMQSKNAIGDYERTSGDLANVVRRLVARLEDLWVVIGSKLIPVATTLATKITNIVERTKEWSEAYPVLVAELTKGAAVLGGTLFALGGIGMALPKVVAGFMALKKVALVLISPLGALVAAIAGIAISVQQMVDNLNTAKKAMSDFAEESLVFKNVAKNFQDLWITVRKEGGEALEQFNELMKRFGGNWDKILKQIIADPKHAILKAILLDIAKGVKKISLEGEDLSIELPGHFQKAADKSLPPFISWATTVAKIFHDTSVRAAEMRRKMRDIKLIMPPIAMDLPKMSLEDFSEWLKQWHKDLQKKWKEEWQEMMDLVRYGVGQLSEIFNQFSASRMQQIDNEYEARRAAIENSILDEEAKAKALGELDKEMDAKRKKAMRTQAIFQKAITLSMAIMNIAEAITKALTLGPFLGIAAATWVKALGGIQIAAILTAPIPSAEKGGLIPREMLAHVHPGEYVVPAPDVKALIGRGKEERTSPFPNRLYNDITVIIGGERFKRSVVKAVNEASELRELRIKSHSVVD